MAIFQLPFFYDVNFLIIAQGQETFLCDFFSGLSGCINQLSRMCRGNLFLCSCFLFSLHRLGLCSVMFTASSTWLGSQSLPRSHHLTCRRPDSFMQNIKGCVEFINRQPSFGWHVGRRGRVEQYDESGRGGYVVNDKTPSVDCRFLAVCCQIIGLTV